MFHWMRLFLCYLLLMLIHNFLYPIYNILSLLQYQFHFLLMFYLLSMLLYFHLYYNLEHFYLFSIHQHNNYFHFLLHLLHTMYIFHLMMLLLYYWILMLLHNFLYSIYSILILLQCQFHFLLKFYYY